MVQAQTSAQQKKAPVVRGGFASVRWVYGRHNMNETALCFRGAKFGNCIVFDYPIRVYTMDLREMDQLRLVEHKGGEYPVAKAAALFRAAQDTHGITRGADRLLTLIENGWQEVEPEILDVKPSEEQIHIVRPPVTVDGEPVDYDPADFARKKTDLESILVPNVAQRNQPGKGKPKGPGERFNDQLKRPQTEKRGPAEGKSSTKSDGNPNQAKRGTILATICAELGIEPADARKRLRAAGMRAPYDDERQIRVALSCGPNNVGGKAE